MDSTVEGLILAMATARRITGRVLSEDEEREATAAFRAWGGARNVHVALDRYLNNDGVVVWNAWVITERGRLGGPIDKPTHWMDAMERAGLAD